MAINDISLTAGMRSNLVSLQQTSGLLDRTQERLSTGKKVNTPIDNAINFFLAKSFTDRASDLTTAKDNMATAIQTAKAADAGIKAISALIDTAKSIATSAKSSAVTTDVDSFETQFNTIRTQINNIASGTTADATFNGVNLLGGTAAANALAVDLGDGSTLTITGFDATASGLGISAADWAAPADADIQSQIDQLTAATTTLRTNTQTLSANLAIVTTRQQFATDMIATLTKGSDNLVLADLNEEGANMLALQTRQSLGVTSLSLASQANQSVLRLF